MPSSAINIFTPMSFDNHSDLLENYQFVSKAYRNLQKSLVQTENEY